MHAWLGTLVPLREPSCGLPTDDDEIGHKLGWVGHLARDVIRRITRPPSAESTRLSACRSVHNTVVHGSAYNPTMPEKARLMRWAGFGSAFNELSRVEGFGDRPVAGRRAGRRYRAFHGQGTPTSMLYTITRHAGAVATRCTLSRSARMDARRERGWPVPTGSETKSPRSVHACVRTVVTVI
ncbi:hypothetical protein MRX96_056274 [Rhipicephalus microplus]